MLYYPKEAIEMSIGTRITTTNEPSESEDPELFIDGFPVSPKLLQGLCFYFCGIRGYASEDFSARWKLVREAKTLTRQDQIICEGEYIVTTTEISDSAVEQLGLTPVKEPRERNRTKAEKSLILENVLNGFNLPGFHRIGNRIRSINPLIERGVFQQYLEYDPKIISIGGRYIIRPNARCVYERTDSCWVQLNDGNRLTGGTKLNYRYQSGTCVFRDAPDKTISDPMDESGKTLIEWYEEDCRNKPALRPFLSQLRSNPDMPVFEVDHDYYNQGKSTKKFSVAALLLSQTITIDDIPDTHRRNFMQNSHIGMAERMSRCMRFARGLGPVASDMIIHEPASTQIAGLSCLTVREPNLEFGDGSLKLKWDPKTNFSSLLRHGPYKLPSGEKRIGLVPLDKSSSAFRKFADETVDFLGKMRCKVSTEILEPWRLDERNRASEYILSDQYGNSDCDVLLVQLKEHSEQHHKAWKRALTHSSTPSQMVATSTFSTYGAQFNVALGILSKLGGLPFGLGKSYTGVQVWVGMDTWREGRKNVAAASVACDAEGLLIGYPNPVVTAGERTDDKALLELLRTTVEGVEHRYGQTDEDTPTMYGLIRDGFFYESLRIVEQVEREYGVEFVVCDVQKFGAPKIAVENGGFESAESGTLLWNGNQGYIQATEQRPGRNTGTPNLLSVGLRKGQVQIKDLLKDLFWLTNIHAGSTQQPGYPIPQYYAHKIAERAGKGVAFNPGFHTDLGIL